MSKQTAKDLTRQMERLSNELITDPEKIKQFVSQWSKGFHRYSLGNLLLIQYQRPGATICAGYVQWKKQDRQVKKGEKALKILAPMSKKISQTEISKETGEEVEKDKRITFFSVVNVFDISQTEGKPVDLGHSELVKGNISFDSIRDRFDYPVVIQNTSHANGSTDGKKIWITEKENKAAMTATLFHEVAHIELNHCSEMLTDTDTLTRDIKEMEAEAVSFLVCSSLGIENQKSAYYLSSYGANPEKLGRSGARIIKVAESILKRVQG